MGSTFDCESLARKYEDFVRPQMQVLLDGREMKSGNGISLNKAEITVSCHMEPNMAVLSYFVERAGGGAVSTMEKRLQAGGKVEIKTGYHNQLTLIFVGYLHEIVVTASDEGMVGYELTCLDVRGLMMNSYYYETSGIKKADQLLKEIVGRSAYSSFLSAKKLSAIDGSMNQICVLNGESDFDWIRGLVQLLHYEFFICGDTLYFRKSREDGSVLTTLSHRFGMSLVQTIVSLTGQTLGCEVTGFDRNGQKLSGKAATAASGKIFGSRLSNVLSGSRKVYVDNSLQTQTQAVYRARALMSSCEDRYCRMQILQIGLPELVPGRFLQVKEEEVPSLSGKLYVEEVVHMFGDDGYLVRLTGAR